MRPKTYDIAIIGGGFAGIALAYNLSKAGAKIILLEANSLCSGSSAACAGRAQIIESETEEHLRLVLAGFKKLTCLADELEIDFEWNLPGHLTLLYNEEQRDHYGHLIKNLKSHGVEAQLLDIPSLREAEPNLCVEGCLGAAFSQEGHLNPFKLGSGFTRAAKRHGAHLKANSAVTRFEWAANQITCIHTKEDQYSAGVVILAAGAWTRMLSKMAGSRLPIQFTHAEAFVTEPLPEILHHHIGLTGFYNAVHGSQRSVTLGVGQHPNGTLFVSNAIQQAAEIDLNSTAWAIPALSSALIQLLPQISTAQIVRSWAAPSPFLPDSLPAIGWLPGLDNGYVAAGFHLAIPTIPLLAEMITGQLLHLNGYNSSGDLKPYDPDRFREQPV